MSEDLYEVRLDGILYATEVSLETAMALVEALFKKWFAEPNLAFEIRRITKSTNADRIRSMTDEELCNEYFRILNHQLWNYTDSRLGLLEWLKEEVKHESN